MLGSDDMGTKNLSRRSPRSGGGRTVTVPLEFAGLACGSIQVEVDAMEHAIGAVYATLLQATWGLAEAYGHPRPSDARIKGPRAWSKYVVRSIELAAPTLVEDGFLDWIDNQKGSDEMFRDIEGGPHSLERSPGRKFVERIADFGTPAERRRLARALGALARVRPGPWKPIQPSQIRWVRKHLARVQQAVKSARDPNDQDCDPIRDLLNELFPTMSTASTMSLIAKVLASRRAHQATEIIVGQKLGVGRDKARQTIIAAKKTAD